MKIITVYDNQGTTADRYAIFFDDDTFFCCCSKPWHPQGIGWHGEYSVVKNKNEIEITFEVLPEPLQEFITENYL